MKIDVLHIAKLANLSLKADEIKKYEAQLLEILQYIEILKKVNTDDIPETSQVTSTQPFPELVEPTFREDPTLMLLIDRRPIDLSLRQLRRLIDYFAVENNPKGVPYAVRYFSLIADTFGPLIVLAIAIPFAVTGVRINPAVGVSKSIGLFALYYVFSNLASALASRQIVDPLVAAWVPNIGMTLVAVWLFGRMR